MHTQTSNGAPVNGSAVPEHRQGFDEGGLLAGEAVGVFCPACHGELRLGAVARCQFAGCPSCNGMMFQQPVFARLVQSLRATKPEPGMLPEPMDPRELSERRLCPTCEGFMETHPYGGPGNAVIDSCASCKVIFLDHGELSKLVNAPGRR